MPFQTFAFPRFCENSLNTVHKDDILGSVDERVSLRRRAYISFAFGGLGKTSGEVSGSLVIISQDIGHRVEYSLGEEHKVIYKHRKETVERSFADAKQLFGHRYARFRSLARVTWQCLLAATAQNIKKIAMILALNQPTQPA